MNNSSNNNGQKLIIKPNRGSAIKYMSFEHLKVLFQSNEIEILVNDIKKIGQIHIIGKNHCYVLKGKYEGSEVSFSFNEQDVKNPEVFKDLIQNRPELFDKFNFFNEIVENIPDYLKYSAISLKLILANILIMYGIFFVKSFVYLRIEHNQWFVNNSCDIDCAKYFISANFATLLVVLSSLLPIVMTFLFFKYQLPKIKKMKKVNLYNVCFIETAITGFIGVMLTFGLVNSQAPKKVYTLLKYYNEGSLSQKIAEKKNNASNNLNKKPASVKGDF